MDTGDMEELYKIHGKVVYGYLLNCTHNRQLAEELTQETFYQAMLTIDRYQGDCKPSVWLCQIAKHIWYKHLKKEKRIADIPAEELEQHTAYYNFEQDFFERRDKLNVYRHIRHLPKDMQEVIYLRLTGDLSFAEIGEILERTEVWARTTYYRGKEKLIQEVEKHET